MVDVTFNKLYDIAGGNNIGIRIHIPAPKADEFSSQLVVNLQ